MKNWDPFVLGPLFAIERRPASVCSTSKFSSNGEKNYHQQHSSYHLSNIEKVYVLIYLEISLHIYSLHQCLQNIKISCLTCLGKKLEVKDPLHRLTVQGPEGEKAYHSLWRNHHPVENRKRSWD